MQATRDDGPLPDDRVDYQLACDEVLAGARRELRIFAPDLDQQLLNRERVSELLVRLARHNPAARVRILLADAGQAFERRELAERHQPDLVVVGNDLACMIDGEQAVQQPPNLSGVPGDSSYRAEQQQSSFGNAPK